MKSPQELRSHRWFGHRSRAKQMGYGLEDFQGKPVSRSSTPGATSRRVTVTFGTRVEEVKRGVWQAGGFPVELPAMSISETYLKPIGPAGR